MNQISVLFLLMGLGFGLAKYKVFSAPTFQQLTWLLCYIVMPCLILKAFQTPFSESMLDQFLLMFLTSAGIHLLYIFLSKVLLNRKTIRQSNLVMPMQFTAVYSNCGFMGIPLVAALMGDAGVFYGSVYIAVNGLFVWTHGVVIYTGKFDRHSLLKVISNPNTVASLVGICFFVLSIKLPKPLYSTLGYIANMNTAISMIVVGAAMTQIQLRTIWLSGYAWISVLMRNLLFPFVALLVLLMFGLHGSLLMIAMVLAACPVAGMSVLFAQLTGKDTSFPCKSLTLSTLASLVTLPIMLSLTAFWGG
ncbi:AEC family transporter [Celerinatantimonas yamalensis]|uniref:AEC family transporter n=1 Tax=Celerinatantimonas yamalensis TaxID=559956 RepID=A0ABW9G3F4_9GAMM